MMAKQCQVIALVAGRKARATKVLTETHRIGDEAVSGLVRSYTPKTEDGDQIPPEKKLPNVDLCDRLKLAVSSLGELYRAVAAQEVGNTRAVADLGFGDTVLSNVPVTLLLFLEKQLTDIRTLVSKMPVLPADREWRFDDARNCNVAEPVETLRTKKMLRNHVKYDATPEHPAQVETYAEDAIIGTWSVTHLSTAIEAKEKADALERVDGLIEAVKCAREEANSSETEDSTLLQPVLDYVFGPLTRRVQS